MCQEKQVQVQQFFMFVVLYVFGEVGTGFTLTILNYVSDGVYIKVTRANSIVLEYSH